MHSVVFVGNTSDQIIAPILRYNSRLPEWFNWPVYRVFTNILNTFIWKKLFVKWFFYRVLWRALRFIQKHGINNSSRIVTHIYCKAICSQLTYFSPDNFIHLTETLFDCVCVPHTRTFDCVFVCRFDCMIWFTDTRLTFSVPIGKIWIVLGRKEISV